MRDETAENARKPKGGNGGNVCALMRGGILELGMAPGGALDEVEIARRFGVPRSPVREAIIRLAAEGLVQSLKNRGATASHFDMEPLPGHFDVQTLLFRATARLAAERGGDDAVAQLSAIEADLDRAIVAKDPYGVVAFNPPFISRSRRSAGTAGIATGSRRSRIGVSASCASRCGRTASSCRRTSSAGTASRSRRSARDVEADAAAGAADAQIVRDEVSRMMMHATAVRLPP